MNNIDSEKKDIIFGDDAKAKLIEGVRKVAFAVGSTLGPSGRNILYKEYGFPYITKDGVTVAKKINLVDPCENLGAQVIKQVAKKTCDVAGDGTTTATILAYEILKEGFGAMKEGANVIEVQRGINKTIESVIQFLESDVRVSIDESNKKEILKQVATVSANWDEELGEIISSAICEKGEYGSISIRDSKTSSTTLSVIDGISYDRGYLTPHFINNSEKMECHFENARVLLWDDRIDNVTELCSFLEKVNRSGSSVLIIAEDYSPSVINTLVLNKTRGTLKVCAIKGPGFGDFRKGLMDDLGVYLGCKCHSLSSGKKLSTIDLNDCGIAGEVVIKENVTTFHGDNGNSKNVIERIKSLKTQIEEVDSERVCHNNGERIKILSGKVSIISVGANSEFEMMEKLDRIDDALKATEASLDGGIVPGGGMAYLKALKGLEGHPELSGDRLIGFGIVKNVLAKPLKQLLSNYGANEEKSKEIIEKLMAYDISSKIGFNLKSEVYEDMFEAGIIDPFKVTKSALLNAGSVSSLLLTTECIILDVEENKHNEKEQIPHL